LGPSPGWITAVSGVPDPPPVNSGELTFLAVDTRTSYTLEYPGSEGGPILGERKGLGPDD